MPRFIQKKDPNESQENNSRMIFFSKTPGQGSEIEAQNSANLAQKSEFEKITSGGDNPYGTKSHSEDKYTMFSNIIEEEKRELNNIQNLIRKRSESLDAAKKMLREKQNLLQAHLDRKTNKFTLVGEMSSKMVHDIKNPLSVIKIQVDLLKLRYSKEEDSTLLDSLGRMERAVNGITNHINDILNFIRESPTIFESNSIMKILNESATYVNKPDNVSIEMPSNDILVECDATKIQRVFTNVILNSVQAMEKGGIITVQVSEQEGNAVIQISDTGSGIPANIIPKIFDPLFTTKRDGTGLGLSTCKRIIEEEHNGSIQAQNNPTTFTIRIPIKQ